MCVPGQRDMEVKHSSILDYSTNSEVTGLLYVSVGKQQLLKFSGIFFSSKCYFLSWVYKKFKKLKIP